MSMSDAEIGKVHNQVKSPWYLEVLAMLILHVLHWYWPVISPQINPNGKVPAITHHNNSESFNVFETSAILLYLAQQFDKDHKFSANPVANPKEYSEELQWMFFTVSRYYLNSAIVLNNKQHGGIGPMIQGGYSAHYGEEKLYVDLIL